jgi:Phytanoyl-CoA dioxygenase (PhyH)
VNVVPADVAAELEAPFLVTDDQRRRFREQGHLKVPGVFSAATLGWIDGTISRLVETNNPLAGVPMESRDTYGKAFIQVFNLWLKSDEARAVSRSRRLAGIATALLGTAGVRMWHDQALFKEPGGGFTPWHADQQYWPMASALCATAWIPLHAVPLERGPLSFAPGSHLKRIGRDLVISDESERLIREAIASEGITEVIEPYAAGEVSFHLGWTLHRAGPNTTTEVRRVHTVIYMDEAMRLAQPKNASQEADHRAWSPSTRVGEVMADALNPVLHSA